MRIVAVVLTLLTGAAIGLVSALVAVSGEPPFGAVQSGAWTAWPGAASPNPDPYARAIFAHDGRIVLALNSGLRFLAVKDDGGTTLDARCDYEVAGPVPAAQFWTLTVLNRSGATMAPTTERSGFTSAELVRGIDGDFAIALARQARPGNWLPLPTSGRFMLMLSLYDTPLGTALQGGGESPPLPTVARRACR